MSPRDIASLAFKLAGIYVILQTLAALPDIAGVFAYDWRQAGDEGVNVPLLVAGRLIPLALSLVLGVLLIAKSRAFAATTVQDETGGSGRAQPVQIHAILVATVGLLLTGLAVRSLPAVVRQLTLLSAQRSVIAPWQGTNLSADTWVWAAGVLLQFCAGVGLILWARPLAGLFHRPPVQTEEPVPAGLCPRCDHPFFAEDYRNDGSARLCAKCRSELPAELFQSGA